MDHALCTYEDTRGIINENSDIFHDAPSGQKTSKSSVAFTMTSDVVLQLISEYV